MIVPFKCCPFSLLPRTFHSPNPCFKGLKIKKKKSRRIQFQFEVKHELYYLIDKMILRCVMCQREFCLLTLW